MAGSLGDALDRIEALEAKYNALHLRANEQSLEIGRQRRQIVELIEAQDKVERAVDEVLNTLASEGKGKRAATAVVGVKGRVDRIERSLSELDDVVNELLETYDEDLKARGLRRG